MAGKRRSSRSGRSSPVAPSQRRRLNRVERQYPERLHVGQLTKEAMLELIGHLFSRAPQSQWLRLIPIDDDDPWTIWEAVDMKWEDVLPVLHRAGLLRFEANGELRHVDTKSWEELPLGLDRRLQVNCVRKKASSRRQYFALIGKVPPDYPKPMDQLEDPNFQFADFVSTDEDTQIRQSFRLAKSMLLDAVFNGSEQEVSNRVEELMHRATGTVEEDSKPPATGGSSFTPARSEQAPPNALSPPPIVAAVTPSPQPARVATLEMITPRQQNQQHDPGEAARLPHESTDKEQDAIDKFEGKINYALALDLRRRPRLTRDGCNEIQLHKRKQADEESRLWALILAEQWGWKNLSLSFRERQRIAQAACTQVAYDFGYEKPISWTRLNVWHNLRQKAIQTGNKALFAPQHKGSQAYIDMIEEKHPGYVCELFRYAQKAKGYIASFEDLANCMNKKSGVVGEDRSTLTLHYLQLYRWFKKQGGKEKAATEKPRLTDDHKAKRLVWVADWFHPLKDNKPFAFLDEKWFYTSSRRRTIKFLPATNEELAADKSLANVKRPKRVSRRHSEKVMYLGVVARPREGFDGRVFLDRVAATKSLQKASSHQRFTHDAVLNGEIRNGKWREFHVDGMSANEVKDVMVETYQLEVNVVAKLTFKYDTFQGQGGNKKPVWIEGAKADLPLGQLECRRSANPGDGKRSVTVFDIVPQVRNKAGDEVTTDVSCDSNFMAEVMPKVGEALREKFTWVPKTETIYLVMDNAGGHGTEAAVQQYTTLLQEKYNVQIVQQVPRSPETNLLDLGIWRSIQAAVEKEHLFKCYHTEALADRVEAAWDNAKAFQNVYQRLLRVCKLIKDDNGDNNMVEMERGKLHSDPVTELPGAPTEADLPPVDEAHDLDLDEGWV